MDINPQRTLVLRCRSRFLVSGVVARRGLLGCRRYIHTDSEAVAFVSNMNHLVRLIIRSLSSAPLLQFRKIALRQTGRNQRRQYSKEPKSCYMGNEHVELEWCGSCG